MVDGLTEKATDAIIEYLEKNVDHWTNFSVLDYKTDPVTGIVKFQVEWTFHDEETDEEYDDGIIWVEVSPDTFSIQKITKDF